MVLKIFEVAAWGLVLFVFFYNCCIYSRGLASRLRQNIRLQSEQLRGKCKYDKKRVETSGLEGNRRRVWIGD